jgi:hypothetical protein
MTLPYLLQNIASEWPDAAKYMANWHYLEALATGSFLNNAGFEYWGTTSFSNPADATSLLNSWSLEKGGTSGATADIARESTTKDSGSYSMKVNITGAGSSNSYLKIKNAVTTYIAFASQTLLAGVKIKTGTGSKVRLSMYDGVNTAYSDYHTGDGTWQRLSASLAVSSTPTQLTVRIEITSDFTDIVYIDSAFCFILNPQANDGAQDALGYSPIDDARAAALAVIPSGTKLAGFAQASAPIGWTQDTALNGNALRLVSGAGAGTGGSADISSTITLAHSHSITSLTTTTVADAAHVSPVCGANVTLVANARTDGAGWAGGSATIAGQQCGEVVAAGTNSRTVFLKTIPGSGHAHGVSSGGTDSQLSNVALKYVNVMACTKD